MASQASWFEAAPRFAVVATAAAALALILQEPPPPPSMPIEVAVSEPQIDLEPVPVRWDLRSGGWAIRVDGTEVSFDTVKQLVSAVPRRRFRLALSEFDELIARHADAAGFDWRLIAAVIFEESRFDPSSESSKGAFGLMQVREIAARHVGEDEYKLPEDNVRTGVRYLANLRQEFSDAGDDSLRFALAAYNIGPAHVRDAQAIADRAGLDPNRWRGGLRETLPLLERPAVARKAEYGFARGRGTVEYVNRVLDRFHEYQRATVTFEASAEVPSDDDGGIG